MEILKRLIGKGDSKSGTLNGQFAVITGGGSGIGFACARALLSKGAEVAILGRNLERLRAAAAKLGDEFGGRSISAQACDVSDAKSVKSVFSELNQNKTKVTILVNCAGIAESMAFIKSNEGSWRKTFDTNLFGAMLCTQEVLEPMIESGFGRVVNVASTAGLKGYAYAVPYSASKHALVGFTRGLALELAGKGVTVNAVCPSFTETELLLESFKTTSKKSGKSPEEIRVEVEKLSPLNRLIKPEEVASAVAWLCEKDQNAINGSAIPISGGETF